MRKFLTPFKELKKYSEGIFFHKIGSFSHKENFPTGSVLFSHNGSNLLEGKRSEKGTQAGREEYGRFSCCNFKIFSAATIAAVLFAPQNLSFHPI